MIYSIETLIVGALRTNCYLLINKENHHTLIIDPGDDADYISRRITDLSATVIGIIATHGHFDHVLAAGELQQTMKIPFYMHGADQFLIDRLEETAQYFLKYRVAALKPVITYDLAELKNGNQFAGIEIVSLPGHTPGSVGLYLKAQDLLLSGDTLFKDAVGRTDFSYASPEQLNNSLKMLAKFPPQTRVLPGHGGETYIQSELTL